MKQFLRNVRRETFSITPVISNAAIYASGDVLFVLTEIARATLVNGGTMTLDSIHVLDKDDQGVEMDLLFCSEEVSIGNLNDAFAISDANAEAICAFYNVPASSYTNLPLSQHGTVVGCMTPVWSASSSRSIWVGAITRGTPTHATGGLIITLTFTYE